ncbi:hypothetical protein AAFF_G00062940 [Aldrovandia affinis]|uniref:Uncharacterized protein n=1 Tax=Aldrovandia affinis TaxID=143900 RepID=A0AAD7WDN9_9TELE|nr:hypothetical protein AAFF_G00062940 [Aldrovandia affinis]
MSLQQEVKDCFPDNRHAGAQSGWSSTDDKSRRRRRAVIVSSYLQPLPPVTSAYIYSHREHDSIHQPLA